MASAVVEVKYFNTFILKKTNATDEPIWNGSFGIPEDIGGYPVVSSTSPANWAIEESRIRGGYNNTTVDFGVKAYIVEDNNKADFRTSSLIYSGIFNSRTGINQTNVFSVGEDITKSADPSNASIQRLYAEDTNLVIFQELKVSRALIDKDAVYSAEGGGSITNSNLVIGTIQPYSGEYGISKNPESFAVYGYQKYFSDRNNNCVLRLSNNGITEISSFGMRDYFRDEVNRIYTNSSGGKIIGGYDMHNDQYVISTQTVKGSTNNFSTLSFDETVKGWVSFFTFKPDQIFSLTNQFYTAKSDKIYHHYSNTDRGNFYGVDNKSKVTVSFNAAPSSSKTFNTVYYEGSNGWELESFKSDLTGADTQPTINWTTSFDVTNGVYSYYEGEYIQAASPAEVAQSVVGTSVLIKTNTPPVVGSNVSGVGIVPNTVVISFQAQSAQLIQDSVANTAIVVSSISVIPPGTSVTGGGLIVGTSVVSFDNSTGLLTLNNPINTNAGGVLNFLGVGTLTTNLSCNFTENTNLGFTSITNRNDYQTVFGTGNPTFPVYHAGFDRKENKYVANLVNNSAANDSEVVWGSSVSGVKGFYALATFSTDLTTDPGGEKQLFSVGSNFTLNNGY